MKVINQVIQNDFALYHADCVDVAASLPENSIDFSVYSPPFESLYTYSNSDRDMGNSRNSEQFWTHYRYLIAETARVIKPGRLVAIHCMNLPTSKAHDGYIGIRDFRGEIIRSFQTEGMIYHSEVCIWKDPVLAMQRTKALGLLHKQIKKDSAMSRQGIADYVVVMRKPGANEKPVSGEFKYYVGEDPGHGFRPIERNDGSVMYVPSGDSTSIDVWQRYASPVWMDINPSDTLQYRTARDSDDERHIAPLQIQVIERAMQLWSMPDDVVWSPFTGIGSEGYVALKMGRKFVGTELKKSYFDLANRNLTVAKKTQYDMFGEAVA